MKIRKVIKIVHWVTTSLVCLLILASAGTYIFDYEAVCATFEEEFGFPAWLVFPMAVAKMGAVIMLISKFNNSLTEWAYAGLTFNMLLAIGTHVSIGDDQALPVFIALLFILTSYLTWKRKRQIESKGSGVE